MSEQVEQTVAAVVISHPVYGPLTRLGVSPTGSTEVYQNVQGLYFVYCNNLLRATINPMFWEQAELSVNEVLEAEVVQLKSAGQPILNFPMKTELQLQDDNFDVVIDDTTIPERNDV